MNKRDFLKLACAAPVIGPVIAKHIATSQPIFATEWFMTAADYRDSVFGMIPASANERLNIRLPGDCLQASESDQITRLLDAALERTMRDVPNRLHGAFIKEDGDAA